MPLKPIYEKSPLTALTSAALRPGQAAVAHEAMACVLSMTEGVAAPAVWEGAIRLAAVLDKTTPAAAMTMAALAAQQEDGSLGLPVEDAVCVMRAVMALYEQDADRALLEKLLRWCGALAANWENVIACDQVRTSAADLMELLVAIYRITGKKAVLTLCEKLRREGMDWSGILHTFAVQRPMSRVTPWADMAAGMEAEGGSEEGLYTRQYLTCHAEHLADGVRLCMANGLFSGSGMELSAGRIGWEKVSRYHGALCGALTSDETIAGTSPSAAVDAAALGAWAEAMAGQCAADEAVWAFEALETMVVNGMPAAAADGRLCAFQRVNSLGADCGVKDCYHVHEGEAQRVRAIARLARGWAAAASAAVTTGPKDIRINLLLPGAYALQSGGTVCRLEVSGKDGEYTVAVKAKKAFCAAVKVRVPAWTDDCAIRVNDDGADEGKPGTYLTLEREWKSGDVITISCAQKVRVVSGHHQSAAVLLGARLMALPVSEGPWAWALCGEPTMENGAVKAAFAPVPDWRRKGSVPADVPVLPACGEPVVLEMKPYAETPCRIAAFPRGKQA